MSPEKRLMNLSGPAIKTLTANNCRCDDWSKVKVAEGFDPSRFFNVAFSGNVKLGSFKGSYTDESGVTMKCGISNAQIHNCSIGSNVLISNIGEYIANYNIEDDVVIKNCGRIHTEGKSTFGNGTEVAVLNETGGRAVKMWDRLSAHEAYIIALYRHRIKAIEKIENMVADYSKSLSSDKGTIGRNTRILNCRNVRNVRFGPILRSKEQ